MEFNRSSQSPFQRSSGPSSDSDSNTSSSTSSKQKYSEGKKRTKLVQVGAIALLFCIVIIVAAVLLLINFGDNSEGRLIEGKKLQAVFLNNGQVYFGKINTLNSNYVDLSNIYYLKTDSTNGQTSNSNISLVKLGCELHGPTDQMIINRSQVTFWENLKTDGQVAKAIATYQQQNPKGQTCSTSSTSNSQSTPNATTPSNTSGTSNPSSSSTTNSNNSNSTNNSTSKTTTP